MSNNLIVLAPAASLAGLLERTLFIQQNEDRLWDFSLKDFSAMFSKIDDLLVKVKSSPESAGIWVSTNMTVIPFAFSEKISLAGAQQMTACHWRHGARVTPSSATVERWNFHYQGKTWRSLCDEEGALNGSHVNHIVSRLRARMSPENKMRFGHGNIYGDVLIINNKCGW